MKSVWRNIRSAPRDGAPVKIKGLRFMSDRGYRAVAVWAERQCPKLVKGWFPPGDKHDGQGPYERPTHWQPIT